MIVPAKSGVERAAETGTSAATAIARSAGSRGIRGILGPLSGRFTVPLREAVSNRLSREYLDGSSTRRSDEKTAAPCCPCLRLGAIEPCGFERGCGAARVGYLLGRDDCGGHLQEPHCDRRLLV